MIAMTIEVKGDVVDVKRRSCYEMKQTRGKRC